MCRRSPPSSRGVEEDSASTPLPVHETSRRVTRSVLMTSLCAIFSLVAVLWLRDEAQGILGAAGAVVVFGGSSLPAKHPAASSSNLEVFQLFVTIGNFGFHLVVLPPLRALRFNWCGVLGAAALTMTQLFAWPAIQRLGAAVGPGIWVRQDVTRTREPAFSTTAR